MERARGDPPPRQLGPPPAGRALLPGRGVAEAVDQARDVPGAPPIDQALRPDRRRHRDRCVRASEGRRRADVARRVLAHPRAGRTPRHAAPGVDEPRVLPRPDASPRVPRGIVLLLGSRPRPLRALRPLLLPGVRSVVEGSAGVQGVRGSPLRPGEARLMRIAVCHPQAPFMAGGAEGHVRGLIAALREAGHDAETVSMPFKWYPPSELVHQMGGWRSVDLSESNGEPIDLVVALKFPAYP